MTPKKAYSEFADPVPGIFIKNSKKTDDPRNPRKG